MKTGRRESGRGLIEIVDEGEKVVHEVVVGEDSIHATAVDDGKGSFPKLFQFDHAVAGDLGLEQFEEPDLVSGEVGIFLEEGLEVRGDLFGIEPDDLADSEGKVLGFVGEVVEEVIQPEARLLEEDLICQRVKVLIGDRFALPDVLQGGTGLKKRVQNGLNPVPISRQIQTDQAWLVGGGLDILFPFVQVQVQGTGGNSQGPATVTHEAAEFQTKGFQLSDGGRLEKRQVLSGLYFGELCGDLGVGR